MLLWSYDEVIKQIFQEAQNIILLVTGTHGIKTWIAHFFRFQYLSILAIPDRRRQETVSMAKYGPHYYYLEFNLCKDTFQLFEKIVNSVT